MAAERTGRLSGASGEEQTHGLEFAGEGVQDEAEDFEGYDSEQRFVAWFTRDDGGVGFALRKTLCVFVDRRLNRAVRLPLALDQSMDVLDGLGCKEFFSGLLTYPGRHVFGDVEIAFVGEGVGHFGFDHCLSHFITLVWVLPVSEVNPETRIWCVQSDDLEHRARPPAVKEAVSWLLPQKRPGAARPRGLRS